MLPGLTTGNVTAEYLDQNANVLADPVGQFGLIAMALFLAILVVGFIYEWKKGALEWD